MKKNFLLCFISTAGA